MDTRMKGVVRELRRVVADAEGLLEAGGEQLGEARGTFGERLARARDRLADIEQELVRSGRRTAREVDRYAHEHPWQLAAIGVAATTVRPRPTCSDARCACSVPTPQPSCRTEPRSS